MTGNMEPKMTMDLKGLPLGAKSFAQIIDEKLLYSDKTRYIYELTKGPKGEFFLSRPRRFGKTLLLHTINELFTDNRERFKGLWIDQSNYTFPRHPVIFMSLSISLGDLTEEQIDDLLSKAVLGDLNDINERGYCGVVNHRAKEIITLGLAIYGGNGRVKSVFGQR
jgi:hypothetical protein